MMQCVNSPKGKLPTTRPYTQYRLSKTSTSSPDITTRSLQAFPRPKRSSQWFVSWRIHGAAASSRRKQNALFNSALRQSTSIRKDLDQFADAASPSPHLQAQLNASLATFARTIDDYGKLARQEPVQTKAEKAQERLKTFRAELDEYRATFKRIKSANEDIVRLEPPSAVTV
jgi:hypothetical protein